MQSIPRNTIVATYNTTNHFSLACNQDILNDPVASQTYVEDLLFLGKLLPNHCWNEDFFVFHLCQYPT